MNTDLYNLKNEKTGTVELPDSWFGALWRPALVRQVLLSQLANARRPWAHAKGRGEVSGGGRKPWRQKGTGRARHGSIRSPLWRGGGKSHGPRSDRDYSNKVNKKMKRAALASVLSKKLKLGNVKVFETLAFEAPKTKIAAETLRPIVGLRKGAKKFDALFIAVPNEKNLFRAVRNLEKTKVLDAGSLNVYDAVKYKHIFLDARAIPLISKSQKKS